MTKRSSALHRLVGDERGNVAILFALVSLPLLGFTGAAIDYGFATRLQVKLQAATDATALALCQTPLATSTADLQKQASAAMTGYMGETVTVDALAITNNPRQIALTTHATSTPFFGKFTGTSSMIALGTTARCATPLPKTFEIALVLDNTGSMDRSDGGQSKMDSLKKAATDFVEYVSKNDAFAKDTRLSVVPFAASVAVPLSYSNAPWIDQGGKSFYHWPNIWSPETVGYTSRLQIFSDLSKINASWAWAGCMETLPYPFNVQDHAPTPSNPDTYFVPMFAPDEPGPGNKSYWCYSDNNCVINTYIDDETTLSNCRNADKLNFDERHARVCKYKSAKGAAPTSRNEVTSLPNGPNFNCTSKPLTPLTSDISTLKSAITSMAPLGATNIYEGLIWGWRTLSPVSVFSGDAKPPAAYESHAVNKILILMSDGMNMWSLNDPRSRNKSMYHPMGYISNANGQSVNRRLPPDNRNITNEANARAGLDALTDISCANAKATSISIYTIGFSVASDPIDAKGLELLRKCASTPGQAFVANDSAGLVQAFDEIAKSIGKLRLTQ